MADCYTKEVIEIAWPRRCRVLTTYAAVVVITVSFLFPANARATDQDMQATTYTLAEIEKLARVPTIEEEMALLQPPENKIDLRVVKPQKIQEAIPLPRATATVTKELVEKKNSGGGVRAFSAVSSPQTNTGVAIINSGINFLISAQAANGSWSRYGEASAISDTVAVLHSLHSLGTTTAGETYTKGIGWLGSQFPDSTLLASQKFWMLAESGEDVSYSFDAIVQRSNDDGGFGYSSKYRSDVSTTASVLEAITASNYTGYGDNPDFIETSAIIFLLNNQNSNGGWGEFTEDESRVLQTTSALGALFPYRDAILHGASGDIAVKEYVEKGLNYLKNIQGTDGAWNQDVSDTALAYEMLHRYGIVLAAEDKAFEYLKSAQEPDGGFGGGSPYVTAQALMALSYRLFDKRPDLVITDITTSSALVNYTPVTFVVTLKNIGGSAISDGRLYNFVGDYNWDPAGFDLRALGMNLAPGDALKVTLNFPVTDQFLGDMNFKFYVEGDGESNYENNWFSKIFRFAGEPSGKPALPVYFIANKYDISGYPALNIRWPMRDDPNRSMYVILYKKKSAQAWKFFGVQNSWDGAFLYPFEEGVTYEVTAGVLHQDGSTITHFSDNPVDITMSSNPLSYTGGVSGKMTLNEKEFPDALTYGYGVSGTTNSDGDISYHNVSNGTTAAWAYYKRYDHIVTKFSISTGATTSGVRLFTRLADDTQPPLVTFFEILEESDHMIENGRNVELGFWAADDKELEEAELSYFNPQTNAWTHIKSIKNIPFNNLMFAGTPWAVGKELLGPGYKVRVVVRDWKGNSSAAAEWGPFEIRKGENTRPAIKITEPDGVNDYADATTTIKWEDSDPDSNATISLFYDTDAAGENGSLIVGDISEDGLDNSYLWDTSGVPTGSYYIYGLIQDDNSRVVSYSAGSVTVTHPPVLALPGPPTNLTGTSTHQTMALITWAPPLTSGDRPITGYRIERKIESQDSFAAVVLDTKSTTTRKYTDTDLTPSTVYDYRVSSLSEAGQSAATPNEMVQIQTLDAFLGIYIFDESLLAPWTDANSKQVVITRFATDRVFTGRRSIRATYHAANGVYSLSNPAGFSTANGDALVFSILSATSSLAKNFNVSVSDRNGALLGQKNLGAYLSVLRFAVGEWYTVSIPLTDLGAFNTDISRVSFASGSTGSFYLDAVGFSGQIRFAPPSVTVTSPGGALPAETADTFYAIHWEDTYDEGNAKVSLYYDTDDHGMDGTLIAANISEDDETDTYIWRTSALAPGAYYIYAVLSYPGGVESSYSSGPVVVVEHQAQPQKFSVFDDSLQDGWSVTAPIVSTPATSSERVFTGKASLKINGLYSGSGALEFSRATSSLEVAGKMFINFAFLPTKINVNPSMITVSVVDANDVALSPVTLKKYTSDKSILAGKWHTYSIPLSDLNLGDRLLKTIRFTSVGMLTLFLDDVNIE